MSDKQFERITGIRVSFEKLYEEIRFFYENRKQCHLHVKINGDDYTEEEQKKFVSLFEDCTDSMNIDHIANIWPDMKVTEQEAQNLYNLQLGDDGFVCPTMFYELVVHSDGTVSPCCMDYDFRHNNLGNVKETTLKEIWRGEKLKSIWVSELQGKTSPYPACNKCNKQANASVDITPYREEILGKF